MRKDIFEEFKNTDSKYKSRVRSRIANLKDTRNPKLRENVLCGLISTERIASMPTEVKRTKAYVLPLTFLCLNLLYCKQRALSIHCSSPIKSNAFR